MVRKKYKSQKNSFQLFTLFILLGPIAVYLLWQNTLALFTLLSLITIFVLYQKPQRWKIFVAIAIAGSLVDIVLVSAGTWKFSNNQLFGIPIWLPLVWGLAASYIPELSDQLKKL